jgi:hypothetical protein
MEFWIHKKNTSLGRHGIDLTGVFDELGVSQVRAIGMSSDAVAGRFTTTDSFSTRPPAAPEFFPVSKRAQAFPSRAIRSRQR